ncbi:unnamed protein product [Brassica rapa subsp. narinosa]
MEIVESEFGLKGSEQNSINLRHPFYQNLWSMDIALRSNFTNAFQGCCPHHRMVRSNATQIKALEENYRCDITGLPPGKKAIIRNLKFNSDGILKRHKIV